MQAFGAIYSGVQCDRRFHRVAVPNWPSFAGASATWCGVAKRRADRLFRLVELMRQASLEHDNAATLAPFVCTDRNVALDPPSILVTKGELTSDKQPLMDNKSLFDAVPLLFPMWLPLGNLRVVR